MPEKTSYFQKVRESPEWEIMSFQQKVKFRKDWVNSMIAKSNKSGDPIFRKQMEEDAYEDAPWMKTYEPSLLETSGLARGLYSVGGAALKLLSAPGQLSANILEPAITMKKRPYSLRGAYEALTEPLAKTQEYLFSGTGERTRPFGEPKNWLEEAAVMLGEAAIDPLMWTGLPAYLQAGRHAAKFGRSAGQVIPQLTGRAARAEQASQVARAAKTGLGIPRSLPTFTQFERTIYNQIMGAGKPLLESADTVEKAIIIKQKLQRIAETIANMDPKKAAKAMKQFRSKVNLSELKKVGSWAEKPQWERGARWWEPGPEDALDIAREALEKAAQEAGASAESISEAINDPGRFQSIIKEMLKEPEIPVEATVKKTGGK